MASDADKYNMELAARQTEINEWAYNNKMDMLFVFQILFISILIITILMMFSYRGVIGKGFVWYVFGILVLVDVLVIINRSMYTNRVRDKKHWDRIVFEDDNKLLSPKGIDTEYINKIADATGGDELSVTEVKQSGGSACKC